jgi:hypothetical protein
MEEYDYVTTKEIVEREKFVTGTYPLIQIQKGMSEPYYGYRGLEIPKSTFMNINKFHEMLLAMIRLDASREALLQMFHEWSYYSDERNGKLDQSDGTEHRGISSD